MVSRHYRDTLQQDRIAGDRLLWSDAGWARKNPGGHLLAIGVSLVRTGAVEPWLFENHPMWMSPAPEGYRWSLWLLYLVTVIAVAILYMACRWYARVKRESRHPLLRYI